MAEAVYKELLLEVLRHLRSLPLPLNPWLEGWYERASKAVGYTEKQGYKAPRWHQPQRTI